MDKQIRIVLLLMSILFLTIACGNINSGNRITQATQSETMAHDNIQFYFTSPNDSQHCELTVPLLATINAAQQSIELALYNINMDDVADALISADDRGVQVQMVLDNQKSDNHVPQMLLDAGIAIVYDPDNSTMHNKFMIVDGQQVWTGSMNFTESGCEEDYNNMVRIDSQRIASNYQAEFAEMFEGHAFSADSPRNTPYQMADVGGVAVETYFSPDDGVRDALLEEIENAESSIVFMAYSFTSDELADAIIKRAGKGVRVTGVMDADQIKSNSGGEYEDFLRAGIPVAEDDIPGQMHHKVIIIDEDIVIMGSYNFSGNAEKRNDENVLVIHSREAAQQYLQAFEAILTK